MDQSLLIGWASTIQLTKYLEALIQQSEQGDACHRIRNLEDNLIKPSVPSMFLCITSCKNYTGARQSLMCHDVTCLEYCINPILWLNNLWLEIIPLYGSLGNFRYFHYFSGKFKANFKQLCIFHNMFMILGKEEDRLEQLKKIIKQYVYRFICILRYSVYRLMDYGQSNWLVFCVCLTK